MNNKKPAVSDRILVTMGGPLVITRTRGELISSKTAWKFKEKGILQSLVPWKLNNSWITKKLYDPSEWERLKSIKIAICDSGPDT